MKARINSFEIFGTVDGPGIRFIVFFQGCPLQCQYCHNRDTWDVHGGEVYTVAEVVKKMDRYLEFYRSSGGGITASGGEPTVQAEFVTALFRKVRDRQLNTAVNTSGFIDADKVKELLEVTDLVLLDLKIIDPEKHLALTGVDNSLILKFARYLSDIGKPAWIRHVLIPGITTGEEDIRQLAEFIKGLDNIKKVELLPYHDFGRPKWEKLGCPYPLAGVPLPSAQEVKAITEKYRHYGLNVAPVGEKME